MCRRWSRQLSWRSHASWWGPEPNSPKANRKRQEGVSLQSVPPGDLAVIHPFWGQRAVSKLSLRLLLITCLQPQMLCSPRQALVYFFIFQENPRLLFSPRLLLPSFQLKCLQYIMPITVARLNRRGPSRFRSSRLTFLSPAPLLMNAFASINTATQVFPASSIKLFNALFETRHRTAIVIAVLLDP